MEQFQLNAGCFFCRNIRLDENGEAECLHGAIKTKKISPIWGEYDDFKYKKCMMKNKGLKCKHWESSGKIKKIH